jgi:hypothetical protein
MTSDVETIMARFPGPVVLRPSNWRWLFVGFIVVAGLGPAIYFAVTMPEKLQPALLALAIVPIMLSSLLSPQASSLTLHADGFELQYLFFGRKRLRWREASAFAAVKSNRRNFVAFDDATLSGGAIAKLNKSMLGRTSNLPDTYGLSAERLAQLLSQWRERALNVRATGARILPFQGFSGPPRT